MRSFAATTARGPSGVTPSTVTKVNRTLPSPLAVGSVGQRPVRLPGGALDVAADHGGGVADLHGPSLVEPIRLAAERPDRRHVVADEEHGAALAGGALHFSEALVLELRVADGEDLVHDEDVGLDVRRDGESQAHVHAGAVALDGHVYERLHAAEGDDLVEALPDLRPLHAQDGAVEVDILAPGEVGMEAGADLEHAGDAAVDLDPSARRLGDAAEDLQKRALAAAVRADDAEAFAGLHLERDVLQRPEFVVRALAPAEEAPERAGPEALVVALPEMVHDDSGLAHQSTSAK